MKAIYDLTRIGSKLKVVFFLLMFSASIIQLQAQTLVSNPADGHYCISSPTGVTLSLFDGDYVTYELWKNGVATGVTVAGGGPSSIVTFAGFWRYGSYTTVPPSSTVIVYEDLLPGPPTSASATFTTICRGSSTTISAAGGFGTTFNWYSGSCNGTPVATGLTTSTLTVSPTVTTTYYGQWENVTCYSTCVQITITVENTDPPVVSPLSTTICYNGSADFTLSGGTVYRWATGSCGTGTVTSTSTFNTGPLTTTTIYHVSKINTVCAESSC